MTDFDTTTIAENIATDLLSQGYLQAVIDGNGDPTTYDLLDGDMDAVRAALGEVDEDEESDAIEAVQDEVRDLLVEALKRAVVRAAEDGTATADHVRAAADADLLDDYEVQDPLVEQALSMGAAEAEEVLARLAPGEALVYEGCDVEHYVKHDYSVSAFALAFRDHDGDFFVCRCDVAGVTPHYGPIEDIARDLATVLFEGERAGVGLAEALKYALTDAGFSYLATVEYVLDERERRLLVEELVGPEQGGTPLSGVQALLAWDREATLAAADSVCPNLAARIRKYL